MFISKQEAVSSTKPSTEEWKDVEKVGSEFQQEVDLEEEEPGSPSLVCVRVIFLVLWRGL